MNDKESLKEAMRNVIRDALLNFDENEFVDYELDVYVDEYLSRAMRLLDREAAITEREFWEGYSNGNQWEAYQLEIKCNELTAERDKLSNAVDKLQRQVDSLLCLNDVNNKLIKELKTKRDNQANTIERLTAELESYRKVPDSRKCNITLTKEFVFIPYEVD